jgi:hypothetical protein
MTRIADRRVLADRLVEGPWGLVASRGRLKLFDRRRNPDDLMDLAAARPITTQYLAARLASELAGAAQMGRRRRRRRPATSGRI